MAGGVEPFVESCGRDLGRARQPPPLHDRLLITPGQDLPLFASSQHVYATVWRRRAMRARDRVLHPLELSM